jgi:hypothetical protein
MAGIKQIMVSKKQIMAGIKQIMVSKKQIRVCKNNYKL